MGAVRLLDRLAGLETEYVARFQPDDGEVVRGRGCSRAGGASKRPLTFELLHGLAGELKRRLAVVPADYPKKGFFFANGGAVWHERPGEGVDHPLIEGSTPECRGARQLLAHQRAQDRMLASAARDVAAGGEFTLCKSDCDVHGNVYGSQENYELIIARSWRLWAWRLGVIFVLAPLMAVGWMGLIPLAIVLLVYYGLAALAYGLYLMFYVANANRLRLVAPLVVRDRILGPWGGELFQFMPTWLAALSTLVEHLVLAPAALALTALAWVTAFVQVRRELLPFLITRAIFCGSGRIARDGKFHIAAKASGMRLINGVGVFRVRSIFSFGPQFKALTFFSLIPNGWFPSLLASRQRLQISIPDGNLCDEAEYLRIGTTLLVLDAIEADHPMPNVKLRRPLRAMRRVMDDPGLAARLKLADGRAMTALEIQRIYLEACRAFVAAQTEVNPEAIDILTRWGNVLDDLETDRDRLVGRVDWITKRWLLEACGEDAPWIVRKKIDLRYHELSPDGYFERLRSTGVVRPVLSEEEIETAMVTPPENSPAMARGRYIRMNVSAGHMVRANWQSVAVGTPPQVTRFRCA